MMSISPGQRSSGSRRSGRRPRARRRRRWRTPMPASASAYRPRTSDPSDRRDDVAARLSSRRSRCRSRARTTMTTMPLPDAERPRRRPSARARAAVASRNSSRPDVSSDAQPPTSVAAARPARISPNSTKRSSRKPPTEAMSMPGKTLPRRSLEVRRLGRAARRTSRPEPAITQPEQAEADAPGQRRRQVLAGRPPDRPAQAQRGRAAGSGVGTRSSPRGRAARTPRRRWRTGRSPTTATRTSGAQSNWPASGRWSDVQPNQVRFANGASCGMAPW